MLNEEKSNPHIIPLGEPQKPSWYELNREKAKATTKTWQLTHPERFKELKRDWARKTRLKASRGKRLHSWRNEGAFSDAPLLNYDDLLENQGNKCGICGVNPTPKRPFIPDHEHLTGRVRGLLCKKCSIAVGYFKTIKVMEYALKYMKVKTKGIEVD